AQILRAEPRSLSQQEINDATASRISFGLDDATFIDTDATLLFDPEADDVRAVIEFANTQLLEMRFLDQQLDDALERAYETLMRRRARLFGLGQYRPELRRLGRLQRCRCPGDVSLGADAGGASRGADGGGAGGSAPWRPVPAAPRGPQAAAVLRGLSLGEVRADERPGCERRAGREHRSRAGAGRVVAGERRRGRLLPVRHGAAVLRPDQHRLHHRLSVHLAPGRLLGPGASLSPELASGGR